MVIPITTYPTSANNSVGIVKTATRLIIDIVSVSAKLAATLAVSDIGEINCPTCDPEATAPATIAIGTFILCAIAIMMTPTVPIVPQDVPIKTEITAQIINVIGITQAGLIT